jgi:hypothetical protein
MGLRFQRRIRLFPGPRINLSKSGASLSLGVTGARFTIGKTPRVTVGIPGSGLSYTQVLKEGRGGLCLPRQRRQRLLGLAVHRARRAVAHW